VVFQELCSTYLQIRGTREWPVGVKELTTALRAAWEGVTPEDIMWLHDCLDSDSRKWFTAFLLGIVRQVPEGLYLPMIMAGIDEPNPSFNRSFIEPFVKAHGHRRVNTTLLDVFETGTDARKAGVANALYWAQVSSNPLDKANNNTSIFAEMEDVWARKRRLLLLEFVQNPNVRVRQCIIPKLNLKAASYPPELRDFVEEAIKIARNHSDDYIRHRVEVQLGTLTPMSFKPLPSS
jgi:hypothetical protein